MEKIKEDLTQPRFEVRRITPNQPFIKMIKFPGSNFMHFEPTQELFKEYLQEIKIVEERIHDKMHEEADFLGGIWRKDLCGICYRSKANAVFLPCNHCEICSSCAVRSTKFNGLCPFCRGKIERVLCYKRGSFKPDKLVYDEYTVKFKQLIRQNAT